MEKALEFCKLIRKDLGADYREDMEERNLHNILGYIYNLPDLPIEDKNRILCFIIYAYSPDSMWLDLKKNRYDNKTKILENLGANTSLQIYQDIIHNRSDVVGVCIFNFLEDLKTWQWKSIFNLLEYAAKMEFFSTQHTASEIKWTEMNKEGNLETLKEDVDVAKIGKVNKDKGEILNMAIENRRKADAMIEELRKEFVATDTATQADFGFSFSDTAKKRNPLSWREYIRDRNARREKMLQD
jgi:hypothetical protein